MSSLSGTVATGLAPADWLAAIDADALVLVPALLAWHATRKRRATIAPIAPFRGVRCILVLHRPYRANALWASVGIGAIYCPASGHVEMRRRLGSLGDGPAPGSR